MGMGLGIIRGGLLAACADIGDLALDDFELIGFPEGAKFAWNGRDLTVTTTPGLVISIR